MKTGELQPVASPLSLNWIIFLSLLPLPHLENGWWDRRRRRRTVEQRKELPLPRRTLSHPLSSPPLFSLPPFLSTIKILLRECTSFSSRNLLPLPLAARLLPPSALPRSPVVKSDDQGSARESAAVFRFFLSVLLAFRRENSKQRWESKRKKKVYTRFLPGFYLGFFRIWRVKGVKRVLWLVNDRIG